MSRRAQPRSVRRLMLFFAVVYTVEGIGQAKAGIVWQPLTWFLKTQYGWTVLQIAASLAVLDVPWIIKPLWGLVSDFVPLFGYRRRSYLLVSNIAAALAFLGVARAVTPGPLVFALTLTAVAMAISSTLCGALLVENGQRHQASSAFVNQQWLWFNAAVAATSVLGGQLIEMFSPAGALHAAALVAAAAPIAVLLVLPLVEETRARLDRTALRQRLDGLLHAFRSRTLWLVAIFLFLYYFSPGFGTPLYFYMTDHLHFSQGFIGMLSAVSAAGWVAGGLIYRWCLAGMRTRALLQLSIVLGTAGTLAYLLLADPVAAVLIYFATGVVGMIANVATLTLAADHCPQSAEGFTFAALMSVINLATPTADATGAFLYEHVFGSHLTPLIILSAGATALVLVLIPLFRIEAAPARRLASSGETP